MTLTEALKWARQATAGEYLIEFDALAAAVERDPGSRHGYSDGELDQIRAALAGRGLSIEADDRGLIVVSS